MLAVMREYISLDGIQSCWQGPFADYEHCSGIDLVDDGRQQSVLALPEIAGQRGPRHLTRLFFTTAAGR